MRIPQKLRDLAPYDPTEGMPAVKLDANESFLSLPEEIADKVNKAVSKVLLNRYPDPMTKDVCKTAADYFGVEYDQIVTGNGSDELISILVNSFLEKGSKILVTKPDFSMYAFYAAMAEVEVVTVPKTDRSVDIKRLVAEAKAQEVSAVFFSNPCNPTGCGIAREDVLSIAKQLPESLIVVDEAYMDFWNQSILGDIGSLENVIVLRTCSKAFGLAGIRLGFAIARKEIIDLIKKSKSPFNINSMTQAAACAVLEEKEYLKSAIEEIVASRDELQNELMSVAEEIPGKIKVLPSVANFVIVESEFAQVIFEKLAERDIIVRKFPTFLRITAGSKEENKKLIAAIREILANC